ncbi:MULTISPECIES: hypothetical protein [unclassified Candidatus Frackibacter]|uniref:hypothetical protein n=1 Tax=unclassified Candidatus Frackibacter TaxID=2648818 RepID=UPI00088824CB|nr:MULTISPECIES: hypothetical protein [unclassified Candidatus Frackibacter]SDC27386.1 hypothetical protein SAMN04515661_10569 [Candidatus Frackibacter sp. WG11]SEM54346.1 hypothetical protein SAMN04488698_10670 [Candidatus Frackibacter sp. WG12]SFL54046.1 hypothetical protein SAMN04488699_10524 [Candidatus Frackibacter sp. WG13]
MYLNEVIEGFSERMHNIAVFKPLFELEQKRKYDYPLMELGIISMLYILESMLRGEKDCTYRKIAYFLRDVIAEYYDDELEYAEALDLTHYLVRESLMNQGSSHQFSYFDFENGENEDYKFHLVKLQDYDIDSKVVKLKLSPIGLELLFKTKEMYNELQVSISQLYLRQQIQKGVFDGALYSVKELALAVKNEKEQLKQLKERIIRDVLQVTREEEYQEQMKRINEQLEREREMFYELKDLIDDTIEKHYSEHISNEAIDKVMELKHKLIDVISLHESLFTDKLRIEKLMNDSIEAMILNAFNTQVNFETEFLEPAVRNDLEINKLKQILDPLFSPHTTSEFNPQRIFTKQVLNRKKEVTEEELWQLEEDEQRQKEAEEEEKRRAKEERLKKYLLLLLKPLAEKEEVRLSQIINNLKEEDHDRYLKLVKEVDFYPFIIQLHQLGVIPLLTREEMQGFVLDNLFWVVTEIVAKNEAIAILEGFELIATEDVIKLEPGYVLSDFIIKRRNPDGV